MMPAATIREVRSSYKSLLCSPNTVSSVRTRRTNHQAQGDKTLIQKPIVVVTMTKSTFSTQSVVYTYIILSLTFLMSVALNDYGSRSFQNVAGTFIRARISATLNSETRLLWSQDTGAC